MVKAGKTLISKGIGDRQEAEASKANVRASISFPPEMYEVLESIANEKKVSVAWVVRDAVEHYLSERWPLFGGKRV